MKLIEEIETALWELFPASKYFNVEKYLEKWQKFEYRTTETGYNLGYVPQFELIKKKEKEDIDLKSTLHEIDSDTLIKIAIDLGVDTPNFIPSIPTFKNTLKTKYQNAYDTFTKAYRLIDSDPSLAVGLVNSALESIIKEILKDQRFKNKTKTGDTLYALSKIILKEFKLSGENHPVEIKTIGSSLLAINQAIEKLRSEKTNLHGKTTDDYIIDDRLYTFLVVNSATTVGLFIDEYFKTRFQKNIVHIDNELDEDLPF
jgi:hypothetical protein